MLLLLTFLLNGKMSTRYLKTNSKAKKGISPVIATVILVAVAVVIAAAMAGFAGSLFGTYSNTQQLSVKDVKVDTTALEITMTIVNKGGSADELTGVIIPEVATAAPATPPLTVGANTETQVVAGDLPYTYDGAVTISPGQAITMKLQFKSGAEITQTITAS